MGGTSGHPLNGKNQIKFDVSSKKSSMGYIKTTSSLEAKSKTTYQKEYVLDEYLMKQIFVGGYQSLIRGIKEGWADKSLEMYEDRLKRRKYYSKGKRFHVKENGDGGGGGIGIGGNGNNNLWVGFVGSFDNAVKNGNNGENINGHSEFGEARSDKNYHGNGNGMTSSGESIEIDASGSISTSFDTYSRKKNTEKSGHSGNSNSSVPSSPSATPSSVTSRKSNKNGRNGRWGTSRSNNNNSNHSNHSHNLSHNHKKSKSTSTSFAADIFGTAFHLLLNLSEKRWDHVAEVARHSAKNANLILDVNEQIRNVTMMEKLEQSNNNTMELGGGGTKMSSSSIPVPPPEYPSGETYSDLQYPAPALPNGVTLQEISYIVATALRSSREKRLVLLFHLLLHPETLVELLHSHPGGGLPTWLLEMDNDWILSYASLGHYYYYGGTPPCSSSPTSSSSPRNKNDAPPSIGSMRNLFSAPKAGEFSSRGEGVQSLGVKELRVDTLTAIETLAILLHYVPQKSLFEDDEDDSNEMNDSKHAAGTAIKVPITTKPKRERTLSYGDKKYHAAKMHVMLADYLRKLQQNSGEAPLFENEAEQFWRLELLDTFWDASRSKYMECKHHCEEISKAANASRYQSQDSETTKMMSLTMEEFMAWANEALPEDSAVDLIMHQIFGVGLLPTPAMERKLVSESWIDWQVTESKYFDYNEFNDTISIMTLGIKNLLTFSSTRDSSTNLNRDDESFILSSGGSAVWGGIGGFDGRGGLGSGVMYCIDKEWWDQWATYVGWEWSDGSIEYASRRRPHDLSTEKLLDQNSDSVVRGTLGSYELMKKDLKKNIDYVLVPPRVWDILYELYGGGPPLPRMIMKKRTADNTSIDVAPNIMVEKPIKVPRTLDVITHPWVLECRVSDSKQNTIIRCKRYNFSSLIVFLHRYVILINPTDGVM